MVIYQAKSGAIEFHGDFDSETIWGNLNQIADLFGRDKSVASRHIKNIFKSGELNKKATVAKIATVQNEGQREVMRDIEYYNLDVILSVGYRVDSKQATQFRIWATKTLKQHLIDGYTIDKKRLAGNYEKFLQVLEDVRKLSAKNVQLRIDDILDLVKAFTGTWLSLESYDEQKFPQKGFTKKDLKIQSKDLYADIAVFKSELMKKGEATELFAQEKGKENMKGIIGNVLQSAFGGISIRL